MLTTGVVMKLSPEQRCFPSEMGMAVAFYYLKTNYSEVTCNLHTEKGEKTKQFSKRKYWIQFCPM